MTLRHLLADLRLFFAFFLALLGFGLVIHGGTDMRLFLGAILGGAGFTPLFLMWLAARAGEK
jgi:hypothetical protein